MIFEPISQLHKHKSIDVLLYFINVIFIWLEIKPYTKNILEENINLCLYSLVFLDIFLLLFILLMSR